MYTYSPNPAFNRFIHITQSPLFLLFIITFCTFSYFFWDQPIARYMRYSLNSPIVEINQYITQFGESTYYYILLVPIFLLSKFILKNKTWANTSRFLLLAIFIPGLLCTALKIILGRTRPLLFYHYNLYDFTFFNTEAEYLSFPSGHASLITSLMIALCFIFSRYWLIFVALFLIISASRIFVSAHYLSDIIAAMYLSILVVPWVYRKSLDATNKHLTPAPLPQMGEGNNEAT